MSPTHRRFKQIIPICNLFIPTYEPIVPLHHLITAASFFVAYQLPCWCVDQDNQFQVYGPLFGAQVNNLQIVSASAAFLHWEFEDDWSGWLAQISPGLAGGKVSIGYGLGGLPDIIAADVPLGGYEIKASYLKTWWPRLNGIPSESLVGLELNGIYLINVTLGVFHAIDRRQGSKNTQLSIGGGIGF